MLRIRMQRTGRKGRPFYRVVIADARVKRQGRYLENLGSYDPRGKDEEKLKVKPERLRHWVGLGAQVSEKLQVMLKKQGVFAPAAKP